MSTSPLKQGFSAVDIRTSGYQILNIS